MNYFRLGLAKLSNLWAGESSTRGSSRTRLQDSADFSCFAACFARFRALKEPELQGRTISSSPRRGRAAQNAFSQGCSRLYYLADRVVEITTEMFKQPRKMVQEISGLGLRHVGFGIPTEMFGPYVSAAVDTVAQIATDENALAGFRWSLTLVAKILVRAVGEGATLVMRAINTNQEGFRV